MSDPHHPHHPHGGHPGAQQPHPQQPQQPQQGPPAWGPAPSGAWGAPSPAGAWATTRDPDARPATVVAAAVLTFVFAGLALLLLVVSILGVTADRAAFVDAFEQQPGVADSAFDPADAIGLVVGLLVVLALWCLAAIVLAVLALRRSQAGRIGLVVSASLSALLCLVGIFAVVTALPLLASVATVICLFTGGANEWYARRSGHHGGPGGAGGGAGHDPRQWSQQAGASAGQPGYGAYGGYSGYPQGGWSPGWGQQPGAPSGPPAADPPAYPTQQGPGRGEQDGPDDDRPVQQPWG